MMGFVLIQGKGLNVWNLRRAGKTEHASEIATGRGSWGAIPAPSWPGAARPCWWLNTVLPLQEGAQVWGNRFVPRALYWRGREGSHSWWCSSSQFALLFSLPPPAPKLSNWGYSLTSNIWVCLLGRKDRSWSVGARNVTTSTEAQFLRSSLTRAT